MNPRASSGLKERCKHQGIIPDFRVCQSFTQRRINPKSGIGISSVPEVSNRDYNFRKLTSLTGIPDATILATQYTDVVTGLTTGKTYWVRVAARTSNSLSRFNYSKIFQVTIP